MITARLGEIADVNWGDTSVTKASYVDSGFRAFSATGPDGQLPYFDYDRDAIVLSAIGARCGKTWFTSGKWSCIKNTIRFWSEDERLDNRYLYWVTGDPDFWPKRGAAQPFITIGDARKLEIPLPPLEEQKRMAAILDQADELRRLRQRAVDHLNALGQAIFHEMFGSPTANERKWEVRKLKDLSTRICSGSTPAGGKKVYVDDGVAFLRSQNVWRRKIELDDIVYIDEVTHKRMSKTSLQKGDILITKTGRINTENSSLGRAALFTGQSGSANINGHVYLIRTKNDVLEAFVEYILAMPEYREYIRRVCVGGIDKRQINKEHLDEFPIIYPPVQSQKTFLQLLSKVEGQKRLALTQLNLCERLFLSLQHRAFRGEL